MTNTNTNTATATIATAIAIATTTNIVVAANTNTDTDHAITDKYNPRSFKRINYVMNQWWMSSGSRSENRVWRDSFVKVLERLDPETMSTDEICEVQRFRDARGMTEGWVRAGKRIDAWLSNARR